MFTDIFIKRPVLATVLSLMILVLGLRSIFSLPILQFPRTQNAVVTISTSYYGADADVVAGFITTPLENAIAQANGIDYMTSSSATGSSTITANLRLNYDADKALSEISTKVSSVLNQLPPQSQQPVLSIAVGQTIDAMYIGFSSDILHSNNITDYLTRVVQPKLQSLEGVQTAEMIGAKNFALRVWMDPKKLAAYGLTASDVSAALAKNDYISGLGNTKGQMVQVSLVASTSLHSEEEFRNLVVKQSGDTLVRLKDVANVVLGSDDYESQVAFDGKKAVYIGIKVAPAANLLDVIKRVRDTFPEIQSQLPEGLNGKIVYDSTKFVQSAIDEVKGTLYKALIIVTLVVFAFLGSMRSVVIPVVAIPLSLIGAFFIMLLCGFTINLLTLLALVLAIGMVVDDAIIVVENVNRHLLEGMKPLDASVKAARELGAPIIAMTVVLVAVYLPIGFQSGLTGALFTEFAFTLAGSVIISAIVALTLSPMLCSKLLRHHDPDDHGWEARLVDRIDRGFETIRRFYQRMLHGSINFLAVTVVFALVVCVSIFFLFTFSKKELTPQEDQGIIIAFGAGAPDATLQQRQLYSKAIYEALATYPETDHVFQLDIPGQAIAGEVMKPWSERKRSADQLNPLVQADLAKITGVRLQAFQPPPLPGPRGMPVQFVIQSTEPFDRMNKVAEDFALEVQKSGLFMFSDKDLKFDQPQSTVVIDREKAAQLGLSMNDVGSAMSSMLGGGYVNYFSLSGRSYKVIPQVLQQYRLNPAQLKDYYIHTADGSSIPLSTIVHVTTKTVPETLNHFQQINSVTISGMPNPGVAMGDALTYLRDLSKRTLPQGYLIDYDGPLRQFVQESSGIMVTFLFALIIIFLALAAQFESFRDPFIILISVPMSIAGALIFIFLGIKQSSLNIYTDVGLVTLMGLVSKHGILIVEFANKLQEEGKSKREAIEEAAGIRLRPILMTTAAMVLGIFPLLVASGAGAASRFNMGLVITSGLTIGTFFTLFVVPAAYMLMAADHHKVRDASGEAAPPHGAKPAPI